MYINIWYINISSHGPQLPHTIVTSWNVTRRHQFLSTDLVILAFKVSFLIYYFSLYTPASAMTSLLHPNSHGLNPTSLPYLHLLSILPCNYVCVYIIISWLPFPVFEHKIYRGQEYMSFLLNEHEWINSHGRPLISWFLHVKNNENVMVKNMKDSGLERCLRS